jgi:hypothetical protein
MLFDYEVPGAASKKRVAITFSMREEKTKTGFKLAASFVTVEVNESCRA